MGVFAMMLLIVHVAIAAANLAEDKCAALRAQNAQLVAQLASRDVELFRLRSELAAIRSAEASTGELRIGTGAPHGLQRGLESDTDFHASKRRRGEIVPGKRMHRTWPIIWNVPQLPTLVQHAAAVYGMQHQPCAACKLHATRPTTCIESAARRFRLRESPDTAHSMCTMLRSSSWN
jgi:hypothetical protein